jgi:hypothetical protein
MLFSELLSVANTSLQRKQQTAKFALESDAEWINTPTEKDEEEFYGHVRKIAGEHGDIQEFSHGDRDRFVVPPAEATDRFVETGDAEIPTKPVGEFDSLQVETTPRHIGKRMCLQCGSNMQELNPPLWVWVVSRILCKSLFSGIVPFLGLSKLFFQIC